MIRRAIRLRNGHFIDRSPTLSNVMIAAGHNMIGVVASPATGQLVAEMLSGEKPHVDVTPFSARRFEDDELNEG